MVIGIGRTALVSSAFDATGVVYSHLSVSPASVISAKILTSSSVSSAVKASSPSVILVCFPNKSLIIFDFLFRFFLVILDDHPGFRWHRFPNLSEFFDGQIGFCELFLYSLAKLDCRSLGFCSVINNDKRNRLVLGYDSLRNQMKQGQEKSQQNDEVKSSEASTDTAKTFCFNPQVRITLKI